MTHLVYVVCADFACIEHAAVFAEKLDCVALHLHLVRVRQSLVRVSIT